MSDRPPRGRIARPKSLATSMGLQFAAIVLLLFGMSRSLTSADRTGPVLLVLVGVGLLVAGLSPLKGLLARRTWDPAPGWQLLPSFDGPPAPYSHTPFTTLNASTRTIGGRRVVAYQRDLVDEFPWFLAVELEPLPRPYVCEVVARPSGAAPFPTAYNVSRDLPADVRRIMAGLPHNAGWTASGRWLNAPGFAPDCLAAWLDGPGGVYLELADAFDASHRAPAPDEPAALPPANPTRNVWEPPREVDGQVPSPVAEPAWRQPDPEKRSDIQD